MDQQFVFEMIRHGSAMDEPFPFVANDSFTTKCFVVNVTWYPSVRFYVCCKLCCVVKTLFAFLIFYTAFVNCSLTFICVTKWCKLVQNATMIEGDSLRKQSIEIKVNICVSFSCYTQNIYNNLQQL